jgi:hypothetical protein
LKFPSLKIKSDDKILVIVIRYCTYYQSVGTGFVIWQGFGKIRDVCLRKASSTGLHSCLFPSSFGGKPEKLGNQGPGTASLVGGISPSRTGTQSRSCSWSGFPKNIEFIF